MWNVYGLPLSMMAVVYDFCVKKPKELLNIEIGRIALLGQSLNTPVVTGMLDRHSVCCALKWIFIFNYFELTKTAELN